MPPPTTDAAALLLARRAWLAALACFVLAGTTGVLFRVGMVAGLPAGLAFDNVRHAHSHLMYYGWVTPLLMGLIGLKLPLDPARQRWWGRLVAGTVVAALIAYVPFLLLGYGTVAIAGRRVPLAVLASSLNGMAWYAFAWAYLRASRGLPRDRGRRLTDLAVLFLVLASLGALARGAVDAREVTDPFLQAAPIHAFLDLFAQGWFLLGVLGLAWQPWPGSAQAGRWGQRLVVAGLPASFLLTVPRALVPAALQPLASAGGLLLGGGLLALAWGIGPARTRRDAGPASRRALPAWTAARWMLALHAVMVLALAVPPVATLGEDLGLRILYLHVLTLGVVTLGVVAVAAAAGVSSAQAYQPWWIAAVAAVVLSLVPLSGAWPAALHGPWVLWLAVGAAAGLVVVAARVGLAGARDRNAGIDVSDRSVCTPATRPLASGPARREHA